MTWRRNESARAATLTRVQPVQRSAVDTEVIVPAMQAAVVSLAWALLAALAVGLVSHWLHWPWEVVALAFLAVSVGLFAWRVTAHIQERQELTWRREERVGHDLDGDGVVGRPERWTPTPEPEPRLIYVRDPGRERRQADAADFRYWLRECYGERGTTWRAWDGEALPSGRRVTRPTWEHYTERLLRAGVAQRPHPTAAVELTTPYRDALQAFREVL